MCEICIQINSVTIDLNILKGFSYVIGADNRPSTILHYKNGDQQVVALSRQDLINYLQTQTNLVMVNMGDICRIAPPIGEKIALKPPRKIPNHLLGIFRPSLAAMSKQIKQPAI